MKSILYAGFVCLLLALPGCAAESSLCQDGERRFCTCGQQDGEKVCGEGVWGLCSCELDTWSGVDAADTTTVRQELEYRYVRVDDLSDHTTGQDPGADIDAVILEKASGVDVYADQVEAFQLGVNGGDNIDPTEALGAPDSVVNYIVPIPDCDADHGFVSLGGSGYLVVHMPERIAVGDNVSVIEVGGCNYGGGEAILERVQVQVSVTADPDSPYWITLGVGEGPYLALSVSSLPAVF